MITVTERQATADYCYGGVHVRQRHTLVPAGTEVWYEGVVKTPHGILHIDGTDSRGHPTWPTRQWWTFTIVDPALGVELIRHERRTGKHRITPRGAKRIALSWVRALFD